MMNKGCTGHGGYSLVLADPPWHFRNWSGDAPNMVHDRGRGASYHYPTMRLSDIKALPVASLCAQDAALLLWSVDTHLPMALDVIAAWGFTYKTKAFVWVKPNKSAVGRMVGDITADVNWKMGMGYYTRANAEDCLLAVRGRGLPVLDRGVRRLIVAPAGRHSAKPMEQYERIERLFGDVPRVELFARHSEPGWDVWGIDIENSPAMTGWAKG